MVIGHTADLQVEKQGNDRSEKSAAMIEKGAYNVLHEESESLLHEAGFKFRPPKIPKIPKTPNFKPPAGAKTLPKADTPSTSVPSVGGKSRDLSDSPKAGAPAKALPDGPPATKDLPNAAKDAPNLSKDLPNAAKDAPKSSVPLIDGRKSAEKPAPLANDHARPLDRSAPSICGTFTQFFNPMCFAYWWSGGFRSSSAKAANTDCSKEAKDDAQKQKCSQPAELPLKKLE